VKQYTTTIDEKAKSIGGTCILRLMSCYLTHANAKGFRRCGPWSSKFKVNFGFFMLFRYRKSSYFCLEIDFQIPNALFSKINFQLNGCAFENW